MKRIRDLKIKNKLIAIIFSITFFSLLIGLGIIILFNQSTLQRSFINETSTIANVLGNGLVSVLTFSSEPKKEGESEIEKFCVEVPSIRNIYIFDDLDELLIDWNRTPADKIIAPSISPISRIEFKDGYLHVFRSIIYKNKKYGTLYLRVSTKERDLKNRNLLITMVLILLTVIL